MPVELILMHLALDTIAHMRPWYAELCEFGHGLPPLAQPAWKLYETILSPTIVGHAIEAAMEAEE